jgi:hypothetical protein
VFRARYPFAVPDVSDLDDSVRHAPARLSVGQRLLLSMPRVRRRQDERVPLGERLRASILKPADPGDRPVPTTPARAGSVEELEDQARYANDKERLWGLLAAPFAAVIGILVLSDLIDHDPAATLKSGAANPRHVNPAIYHDLTAVILGLAVLMLATAWFRKRLYLGMVMALYGLAIFNLHYWGFGIPFILGASYYLVRSYRTQRALKEATGEVGGGRAPRRRWSGQGAGRPSANTRYTPPSSAARRSSLSKSSRPVRTG